jgi:hypothetical protein
MQTEPSSISNKKGTARADNVQICPSKTTKKYGATDFSKLAVGNSTKRRFFANATSVS